MPSDKSKKKDKPKNPTRLDPSPVIWAAKEWKQQERATNALPIGDPNWAQMSVASTRLRERAFELLHSFLTLAEATP